MSLRCQLILGILCAAAVVAVRPIPAQQPDAARFIIHGKDGMLPPAELHKLSAAWSLERAGNKDKCARGELVRPQQAGRARPAPLADNFILLANGDRLAIKAGTPVRLHNSRFAFVPAAPLRCQEATELSLFRPYVALVLLSVPEGIDDVELLVARLQREPREHDIVLLRNGDRIEGAVSSLSVRAKRAARSSLRARRSSRPGRSSRVSPLPPPAWPGRGPRSCTPRRSLPAAPASISPAYASTRPRRSGPDGRPPAPM